MLFWRWLVLLRLVRFFFLLLGLLVLLPVFLLLLSRGRRKVDCILIRRC